MSFGKFISGIVVGGAVGYFIGLLLAPRKGSETRSMLREDMAHRYHDTVDPVVDSVKDTVKDQVEHLHKTVEQLTEKVKTMAHELEEKGEATLKNLSSTLKTKKAD